MTERQLIIPDRANDAMFATITAQVHLARSFVAIEKGDARSLYAPMGNHTMLDMTDWSDVNPQPTEAILRGWGITPVDVVAEWLETTVEHLIGMELMEVSR